MTASTPVLMIIFIFAFVPLILAEVARKKSIPTTANFFIQDRSMHVVMVFFTVYATWVSSFAFLGSSSSFYSSGPVYMTAFAWNALFGILFMVIGKRIWFYGKSHGYITPTDFFNDIYSSTTLNIIVTVIMLVFTLPYLQIQLSGGAYLIEIATGGLIPWRISGLLFYLIIIIYLWAGGMRAVALTDIFYGILIFISMLTVGFYTISKAGGMEYVFDTIIEMDRSNVILTGTDGETRILYWLSMFVVIPVGAIMGPQLWTRAYSVGKKSVFKIMPFLLTLGAIMYLGSILSGSAGIVLVPNVDKVENVIPLMLVKLGTGVFPVLMFCGIASAALSTANSQIHAVAAIYTIDIHKRYFNKNASEKKLVFIGKWAVLFISAFAFLLLIESPVLIVDTGTLAMCGTAQIMIPTLGALFWNKSNAKAASLGLSAGMLVLLTLRFGIGWSASYCGIIALLVNGVIFITLSKYIKTDIKAREKITQYKKNYDKN